MRTRALTLCCSIAALAACGDPSNPGRDAGDASRTDAAMDVARPDVVIPPVEGGMEGGTDPCAALADCGSCTAMAGCGFCAGTGRCQSGTAAGSADGMCTGAGWGFGAGACMMPPADAGTEAGPSDSGVMCPAGLLNCAGTCVDTQADWDQMSAAAERSLVPGAVIAEIEAKMVPMFRATMPNGAAYSVNQFPTISIFRKGVFRGEKDARKKKELLKVLQNLGFMKKAPTGRKRKTGRKARTKRR